MCVVAITKRRNHDDRGRDTLERVLFLHRRVTRLTRNEVAGRSGARTYRNLCDLLMEESLVRNVNVARADERMLVIDHGTHLSLAATYRITYRAHRAH